MAKKKSKKDERQVVPHEEMVEILEQPTKEIDPETLCEEFFGHPVNCGKCHTELATIGEICVTRGRVPQDFFQALYRIICIECAQIVEEAIEIADTKGEVVGYERARNGALYYFRKAVEDGLKDDGCLICGKSDLDKPDKFRHRIIVGLPTEIWKEEPEMRMLKDRQVCEFHSRSANLAGFIMVRIQKALDRQAEKDARQAEKDAKLREKVEKFNQRNHLGTVVSIDKARKAASDK